MLMKRVGSFILSLLVCFTLFTGTSSAGTTFVISDSPAIESSVYMPLIALNDGAADVSKIAAALNKLNILQGENGDYKLGSQATRSEAAALIIRMLGKENYVKQNSDQLKYTKFIDVTASKWYAPYIGYCVLNNILSGKTINTFAPTENTTEKQFLKMALGALGYVEGTDFDWSNIYQKAYSIGIVTDPSYVAKTQDNTKYFRSEAAKVIYRSLNTQKKGTSKKLVYVLVDEGSFTQAAIAASGVISDDQATVIDLVTPTASDTIEVNLNENIQNVNATDIIIYSTAQPNNTLTVKSAAFKDDKIQVITSGQLSGMDYTVRINSVTDINGNISSNLTGSFKGYLQQQIKSDFFRISKVEQVSSNVIDVYFTHPVNENCEIPSYYELRKNGTTFITGSSTSLSVKKRQSSDNAVSILLKNSTLTKGDVYSLKISGKLTSSYGTKLGSGLGESMDFVSNASQPEQFEVSSVNSWSSTSARIVFSREVDVDWASKKLNYTVYDPSKNTINVTSAVVSDSGSESGREVILNLASSLDKTKQYEVKIDFIPDIYKQSSIEGKSFTFSGAYPENTKLELYKAVSDYNNCAVLLFSKALDKQSAENRSNYTIQGINDGSFSLQPVKAYYTEQYGQYAVKLFLPAGKTFSSSQRYTVYATSVKDVQGVSNPVVYRAEFSGGSKSVVKPQIADAVTVANDTVKLFFDIEIAFDVNNISTTNYSLEYVENGETIKEAPVGVTYVDANTLILKFNELDQTKAYQIRFNTMNDYSGLYPRTSSDGGNTSAVRWGK